MTAHEAITVCSISLTYLTTEPFHEKQLSELVKGLQKTIWETVQHTMYFHPSRSLFMWSLPLRMFHNKDECRFQFKCHFLSLVLPFPTLEVEWAAFYSGLTEHNVHPQLPKQAWEYPEARAGYRVWWITMYLLLLPLCVNHPFSPISSFVFCSVTSYLPPSPPRTEMFLWFCYICKCSLALF